MPNEIINDVLADPQLDYTEITAIYSLVSLCLKFYADQGMSPPALHLQVRDKLVRMAEHMRNSQVSRGGVMLIRDHFAADVACIVTKARVIECEIRGSGFVSTSGKLDDLKTLSLEIEDLINKWEGKLPGPAKAKGE